VRLGLALFVLAFLTAATRAAADSILFVRDGNVWISTPDGSTVGAPVAAVPDNWMVASGPHDPRVSPDGSKVAYWFTGRRRFCLPVEPTCPVEHRDFAAYGYAGRTTDPLELGPVSGRRQPSWYGSGRALVFRRDGGSGEAVAVNRVGHDDADNHGWFSYDDGTQLGVRRPRS
jgi:hypothetical protein